MKLPTIDPLIQNFHNNLLLDPMLKHEADELIEYIEYDNFDEIRIQFLEKIDFSAYYRSTIGNDAMFQKKYYLYYTQKEQSLELCFSHNNITLYKDVHKESKSTKILKSIIESVNWLSDIKLINKLFGTHFNNIGKVYF